MERDETVRDVPTMVGIESYEFRVVFKFSYFRRLIANLFSCCGLECDMHTGFCGKRNEHFKAEFSPLTSCEI